MGYTIRVLNRAKIYLAIQESSELPETDNKDRSHSVEFTSLLSKNGWIKMGSMITTSCCKIKTIWEMNQMKKGVNAITLPQIKTNHFRLLIFIAGKDLSNIYLTQKLFANKHRSKCLNRNTLISLYLVFLRTAISI